MKKHLLLFILIICSSAFLSSIGYGQEVTYNTSNQFYYNPFDNGSLGVLNNYIAGTTNKTVVTAATSAAAFNGTTALTSVAGVNAKNNIYGQFIPGSADQNLNNNDFEWTFLYKNNSSTSPIEPYDNGQKAGPVNSGEAAWQYWLTATGNDQTSATVQGFYMTQIGTNMILRYRNNQFDIQSLITFPITNNVVWTIKVQRLTTGRWRIWANPVSTNSEAITYVNQADQGAFNTYAYSMLATTDLRTTGNFYFDSFKLYTRKMTVTGINAASYGITQPSYYPNQSNIALFGMQISIRGTYSIYSINTGYTNSLGTNPNAFFSSAKVVKSIDDTYATTADNTTIATFTPDSQPFQSGAISGGDVNYSSGNTDGSLTRVADYFLVFSMLSSINYGNPAPYTSYVFTGPSQITTTDYQTPPSGGYTNNATSGNNTITFAAGPPPTISYTAPAAYTVGTAIATLTPTTTGSPTSYSTTGLPPGLSLNTSTGQITGTPTSSSPATSYTVTATNANGSASTTVSMTVNGPPVISYATPQTYTVGTAIPTLDDVSSGTAVGTFGYGTAASFGIAAGQVFGLATDASGNIYGADYTNGIIYKYTSTGTRTTFITIGQNITDIAIDGLGNFYFAGFNSNSVYKYNSSGVLQATITGFSNPYQIETDAANNVYVTNYGAGTLSRILAGATTSTTYATGLTGAAGITIDNAGNLYVSSYSAGTVVKIPAGSTTASAFASGFNGPRALTADNAGNIFVADGGNNAIKRITSAGVVSAFLSGFNVPGEIVFDPSGNAYISNSGNTGSNNIFKAVQTGGYFINKPLSAGLYFDVTNGQFTGTPTAVSAATTYTVTAYNAYGSGSTTVNITVNPAAPIISYTTPQTYSVGTAITPLPPTNTGGPVGGYAALSTFASVNNTNGLAIDASNNVYVTSTTGNALYKYNSAGTLLTTTAVTSPYGVAVDQQGNVYVASGANVLKYNSAGTLVTTITGFSLPWA